MTSSLSSLMGPTVLVARDAMTEADKWKFAFDNATKLVAVGFLSGSVVSFLLFKSVATRMAFTAFGAGFGLGQSYVDTRYLMGHDTQALGSQWRASSSDS